MKSIIFEDFDSFNAMINKWAGVDKKEYLSYLLKDETKGDFKGVDVYKNKRL